jgi:hypothetical protein
MFNLEPNALIPRHCEFGSSIVGVISSPGSTRFCQVQEIDIIAGCLSIREYIMVLQTKLKRAAESRAAGVLSIFFFL